VWRAFLDRLAALGLVRLERDRIALRGHEVKLSGPELAARNRLETLFRDAGLDPPDPEEAARSAGPLGRKLLQQLEAEGSLARIRDGRYFHAAALAELRAKLRLHARTQRKIDVGTFKEIAGVTRKNAIPLLEQLDAERFTRRVGNLREILAPAEPE
jgi:selenocysteine-specific elongation factor